MIKLLKIASLISIICLGGSHIQATAAITQPGTSVLEQSNSFFNAPSANFVNPDDIDNKFVIYFNDGTLNIKYNKPSELTNGEVIVYNLLGQELARKRLESISVNQVVLSVQNTCYIVKISYSGKVHTQKVVPSIQ